MNQKNLFFLLKTGLAVAAIGYLVHLVEVDRIVATAALAHTGWIVAALALLPLNVLLEGASWHLLVQHEVPGVRWRSSYASLLAGHALGFLTPARLGVYAGRAFALDHRKRGTLMALVFTDHLVAKTIGVSIGLAALAYYLHAYAPTPALLWKAVAVYGVCTTLALAFLLLFPHRAYHLLCKLLPFARLQQGLRFLQALRTRRMLLLLLLALLRYGVFTLQFVLLLRAFAPVASLLATYAGITLVFFAKFLLPTVTLLDLGIREGAAVYFLGQLGYAEAAAFNAAFLLFCINLLAPAIVGLPFVFRLKLGASE